MFVKCTDLFNPVSSNGYKIDDPFMGDILVNISHVVKITPLNGDLNNESCELLCDNGKTYRSCELKKILNHFYLEF